MSYKEDILRYEQQLMRWVTGHDPAVKNIFDEFINRVSPYLSQYKQVKPGQVWYRNRSIELSIKRELQDLQKNLQEFMLSQGKAAWSLSTTKTNKMVSEYIKGMSISNTARSGMFTRNLDALKTFQQRRVGGMNLSDRVWQICDQTKENIEYYLQSGISSGRSAAKISQDVRSLLNNPDARFRRIKDPETGKFKLSKPMAAYHPGQGVYRSAFKNALRMTRTETNMAYRMSDQARWKTLDFVTGYEVKLSNAHPEWDICDSMIGEYSKDFIFEGWHPNCYCYTVPILLKKDEFAAYLRTGQFPQGKMIQSIPAGAARWVEKNSARLGEMSSRPYWLKDNFKVKNAVFVPKEVFANPDIASLARSIPSVSQAFDMIDKNIRPTVLHSLSLIDKVHYTGTLPNIPVLETMAGAQGQYVTTLNVVTGERRPLQIGIEAGTVRQELSFIHEVGHFLDHVGMGDDRFFETTYGHLLDKFKRAAHNSSSVQMLMTMKTERVYNYKGRIMIPGRRLFQMIDYLLEEHEIFARAYAQYITTKTQDPRLLSQFSYIREMSAFPDFWDDDDFIPLMDEIDELFDQLGWLK